MKVSFKHNNMLREKSTRLSSLLLVACCQPSSESNDLFTIDVNIT